MTLICRHLCPVVNLRLSVFPVLQCPDIAHLMFTVGACRLELPSASSIPFNTSPVRLQVLNHRFLSYTSIFREVMQKNKLLECIPSTESTK